MSGTVQSAENPGTSERRLHPRQQLWFPRIQLGDHNGGIVLNISERGLAMMVVRSLADDPLRQMHFQLSDSSVWVDTRGRIAWVSASKTTAGVEFVDLPDEGHARIKRWISSLAQASASVKESTFVENIALNPPLATLDQEGVVLLPEPETMGSVAEDQNQPVIAEDVVTHRLDTLDSEGAVSLPEPETTGSVVEDQNQPVIAGDPVGVPPGSTETESAETVSEGSAAESTQAAATENSGHETASPITVSHVEKYFRESGVRERALSFGKSGRFIGVWVLAALLLSILAFLAVHLGLTASNNHATELPVAATGPALPPSSSPNPTKPSIDSSLPLDTPGFVLQVGAVTHKGNADALAESLRKRNFPVFVSPPGTDRFYRVDVGPFHDTASTSKVKEELSKQGFDAFRVRWNPSAQR